MRNNNIIIVGVCDKIGSTNISMSKAFMRFGFNVIPVNYRTIISDYGMEAFETVLMKSVVYYKPQLVIFCKCNGVNSSIVRKVTNHTKTWLWNPDVIVANKDSRWCRSLEVIEHARNSTFSSCTSVGIADHFRDLGVHNCYCVLDGCDIDVFRPVEPIEKLEADISFIGSKNCLRDEYKKLLENAGYTTRFYGPGYTNEIVNDAFAQVCSSSKYMLSINNEDCIINGYFSNRLLRYLGCGSCVFHYDPSYTLSKYFVDNDEIILFRDKDELIERLDKMTDKEACRIAMNGREKVLKYFTWENTVQHILNIVFNRR